MDLVLGLRPFFDMVRPSADLAAQGGPPRWACRRREEARADKLGEGPGIDPVYNRRVIGYDAYTPTSAATARGRVDNKADGAYETAVVCAYE
jgi:hypothetical protein